MRQVLRPSATDRRLGAREGDLALDGDVATGLLGADWTRGRWTTGLLVTHSLGDGSYRRTGADTVTAALTGVWPWVRLAPGERLSVWGVAGFGEGAFGALQRPMSSPRPPNSALQSRPRACRLFAT